MSISVKELEEIVEQVLEANEQAFAVLAGAIGDVIGRDKLSAALDERLARAQSATASAARDMLLTTAIQALRIK